MTLSELRSMVEARGGINVVARASGIHRTIIQNWLRGTRPRDPDRVRRLIEPLPYRKRPTGMPRAYAIFGREDGAEVVVSQHITLSGACNRLDRMSKRMRDRLSAAIYSINDTGQKIGEPLTYDEALEILDA